ncbi:MAG: TIGR03118 family protein [Verrucomicrobiota bacterium]
MKTQLNCLSASIFAGLAMFASGPRASAAADSNPGYVELNLVSDVTNAAVHTDARLLNPWGIVIGRNTLWINDNHSGLDTTYSAAGAALKSVIFVPAPGGGPGAPTGIVFNDTAAFVLTSGAKSLPATFLMATEDGTIAAWNEKLSGTNAMLVVDRSGSNAIYKGLAIGADTNGAPRLYAADFHNSRVDMFDGQFQYLGSFADTNVPDSFAPFNVKRIRGKLFVTFAKQLLPDAEDDEAGPGNGYVDIADGDGTILRRFASQGALNSPWGMVVAPQHFGVFSRALLVGNFGDGRINAYDLLTGQWLGTMRDPLGNDIILEGLWGLTFEKDEVAGKECEFNAQRLYFTAGPGDEADGLVGVIRPVAPVRTPSPGGGGW